MCHTGIASGVVSRIDPIAPKISNGRDSRIDVPYNRISRNDDVCHKGVLCTRDTCGNLNVSRSCGDSVPCDVYDFLAPFPFGVFDIPCLVLSAIRCVCHFL